MNEGILRSLEIITNIFTFPVTSNELGQVRIYKGQVYEAKYRLCGADVCVTVSNLEFLSIFHFSLPLFMCCGCICVQWIRLLFFEVFVPVTVQYDVIWNLSANGNWTEANFKVWQTCFIAFVKIFQLSGI
jgi:hypothetical protein